MLAERYNHVESRKSEGAHYTPEVFSNFISNKIISNAKLGKSIKIVDPAVGDGELIISLIRNLKANSIQNIDVYGFDTNKESIEITKKRLLEKFPDIKPNLFTKDFLEVCLEKGGVSGSLSLFTSNNVPDFDLLIANPPYIRTQVLGAKQAQSLSKKFGLKGRVDIYQAFLVAMKAVLSPNGVAGVIVSNRFLTTKGASMVRESIYKQYSIKGIWDFGDTKVFEAAVLPAVMVLSRNKEQGSTTVPFSSVYFTKSNTNLIKIPQVTNQIEALNHLGIVPSTQGNYIVKHGNLAYDSTPSNVWRLQDDKSQKWLHEVTKNTWCLFKEIGKIRVGVKTTADKIFIHSNWKEEVGCEPELLKPLTTHHVSGRFRCTEGLKKAILYTHTMLEGKRVTININNYPISKRYLEKNKEKLAGREYVIKANRKWFEIWVPQNPSLWEQPKIIFRDIAKEPTFWMDNEGTIVNGDCYWMLCDNDKMPSDILWLVLAVANSKFIEDFYDIKFQNKLYSNRRRFITQYVEQFPVPNPNEKKAQTLISLAKECYKEKRCEQRSILENEINELVWSIFNVKHL